MSKKMILEACVYSVDSAVAAEQGGANRVELCDNQAEGGTTPSEGAIKIAREMVGIDLNVMIRPRGGDFCFSDIEFKTIKQDIIQAKKLNVDGVVIGLLKKNGCVDTERLRILVEIAKPLSTTFNRAFDMCRDPFEALEELTDIGIDRILTSGQANTAKEGLDIISELVKRAGERIIIMAGGGITQRDVVDIVKVGGVNELHVSGNSEIRSCMTFKNYKCKISGIYRPTDYMVNVTNDTNIRNFKKAINNLSFDS